MRKNNMLRLASVLLVAVLLSTCAVAGAFAKYQTILPNAKDEARVAKWGVKIAGTGNIFDSAYGEGDVAVARDHASVTVRSEVGTDNKIDDVVAPGTKGTLAQLSVIGKPEVDVRVTYDAKVEMAGWTANSVVYCPIVFKVGEEEFKIGTVLNEGTADQTTISTTAALCKAIEDAIEAKTQDYDANTDLSAVNDDVIVTWAWDYNADTIKDTALGDAAADGNAATVKLTITTTITQID